jgi:hypothetical protein
MVEQSTRHPKVEGLSPAADNESGKENIAEKSMQQLTQYCFAS